MGNGQNQIRGAAGGETKEKVPLSVVKEWVDRAKKEDQGVHQTTTLQALVNLKRPTLTLVPVVQEEITPADGPGNNFDPAVSRSSIESHNRTRHTLKFVYDSSAPQVKISITVHPKFTNGGVSRTIHSSVHAGGFGLNWELPHENALDIGQAIEDEKRAEEELLLAAKKLDGDGSDGSDNEEDDKKPNYALPPQPARQNTQPDAVTAEVLNEGQNADASRLPFMNRIRRNRRQRAREEGVIANIRRNQEGESVEMGPVGPDATIAAGRNAAAPTDAAAAIEEARDEEGMRIIIRLDGLDEQGSPLRITNAQMTHVLLGGTMISSAPAPATGSEATAAAGEGLGEVQEESETAVEQEQQVELKRVWYIKVVRRDAIIGHHTFMLKEIYGLASSSHNDAPAAVVNDPHASTPANDDTMASAPNECIVCLTNPRDVVLLPCRHLVVCRECAVGMIEFGAGGKVARREDAAEGGEGGAGEAGTGAAGTGEGSGTAANATATAATPARERRKKKPKGWFCPVCRQPYTSLLRLALPIKEAEDNAAEPETVELSRAPSRGAASIRSTRSARYSLHRVSSRATLPERGERMLQQLADEEADNEQDDDVPEQSGQAERKSRDLADDARPQFVLANEVELGEIAPIPGSTPAPSVRAEAGRASVEGRRSLEGKGWKEAA